MPHICLSLKSIKKNEKWKTFVEGQQKNAPVYYAQHSFKQWKTFIERCKGRGIVYFWDDNYWKCINSKKILSSVSFIILLATYIFYVKVVYYFCNMVDLSHEKSDVFNFICLSLSDIKNRKLSIFCII